MENNKTKKISKKLNKLLLSSKVARGIIFEKGIELSVCIPFRNLPKLLILLGITESKLAESPLNAEVFFDYIAVNIFNDVEHLGINPESVFDFINQLRAQ